MRRRAPIVVGLVLSLFVLSALTITPSPASAVSTVVVSMPNGAGNPSGAPGYAPENITVIIGINNTVEWTNNDTVGHTVTSVSGNGSLDSGHMNPNANYTYTFTTAGTYDYYCIYHLWMVGSVVVKAAAGVSTVSTASTSSSTVSTHSTTTTSSTAPEFPVASLALVLLAVIAVALVIAPRLRPILPSGRGRVTGESKSLARS